MGPQPPAGQPTFHDIRRLIDRMATAGARLTPNDARRHFHSTYTRTTKAVASELRTAELGGFADPAWVERWDVAFAELYLAPFEAWEARGDAVGPWASVFRTARHRPGLPGVRHVLFGINVHVNFDLPQALLAVMTDQDFGDPTVRGLRERDHVHIDAVLAGRVSAEDRELDRSILDRMLAPLNRRATRRFLTEARAKVWRNAVALNAARRDGPQALQGRIDELGELSAARVDDLIAPGQVVLKLARKGFGVVLPGA